MAKEKEEEALDAVPSEVGAEDAGKKKGGPLPEFVILILKIVAGAIGAILLSATVSVIVFSLMQGDKPAQQTVEASPVYNLKPPVHEWFSSVPDIRATTADDPGRSVILKVVLAFDSKADVTHFAQSVSFEAIAANDYNLSVSSYIEARDNREVVDIAKLNAELKTTVARIDQLRKEIDAVVAEIEGEGLEA